MADTAEDDRAAEPEAEKSFLDSFTAADMRSFIVTVAGTVVGGVLLALVLAGSVLIAKWLQHPRQYEWAALAVTLVIGIVVIIPSRIILGRRARRRGGLANQPAWIEFLPPTAALAILYLLGLLGFAVGIK